MIDTLIIKKLVGVVIEKNIGRIFHGHNIVEYKSPEDNLTIVEYNKAFAYLYLYAALNNIDTNDITLTLVVSNHPASLLKYLKCDLTRAVECSGNGIYYVTGERAPVQIIETRLLSADENLWLQSLRHGLNGLTLRRLLTSGKKFGNDISAYIYAILKANKATIKGVDRVTLFDVLMDIPELKTMAEELGYGFKNEMAKDTAKRMILDGQPYEKISHWLLIPVEEVADIANSISSKV